MSELIKIGDVTEEEWSQVNEENRKLVVEYIRESTQLSHQTLKQYYSALRIYFNWIRENADNKSFYEIKPKDYLMFQNFLVRNNMSSSAIKFKRSAVSSLNNYILLYYGDEHKDFRQYVTKGIASPPPSFVNKKEPLTLEEYEHLCNVLEEKGLAQQLAYIRFSFASGARRAEVRQLLKEVVSYEPKIISTENGEIKTYFTNQLRCKGRGVLGKVRRLQFDQKAMDTINKWLSVRGEDDCPYVFALKKNGKYGQTAEATFNSWSSSYFEDIVGRRFHPHLIRQSRATTLVVEEGKDIKAAQSLFGHKSSTTTDLYVVRKDEDDADDAFT